MAALSTAERATRAAQGGNRVNNKWKRYLAIGIVSAALLLGLAASVAAGRYGGPAAAVPDAPVGGGQYGLSGPNERDPEGSAGSIPASGPATYRVSGPNETDPEGTFAGGAAPATQPTYRVGPPNESDPAGP